MLRLRSNFHYGFLDEELTVGGTQIESSGLTSLPVVTLGEEYLVITLDPRGKQNGPEIVHVTAHASGSSLATIEREKESTTAAEHPTGTEWSAGLTAFDFRRGLYSLKEVSGGASLTVSATEAPRYRIDLDQDITITLGDVEVALFNEVVLEFIQDATPRSVTWDGSISWSTGTEPVLASDPGDVTVVHLWTDGSGATPSWRGAQVMPVGVNGPAQLGPWVQDDVTASQTDVALALTDGVRTVIPVSSAGEVTAVTVFSNETVSGGSLTVEVIRNGSSSGLTAVLSTGQTATETGAVSVQAGDLLGVNVTTDGSWAPTTADVTCMVQVSTFGASGGGSSPSWVSQLAAPDDTPDGAQEFDGDTVDGTLVEPGGTTEWAIGRGLLSVKYHSQASSVGTGRVWELPGTWQVGSYVEMAVRAIGKLENYTMFGPLLSDGALTSSNIVWQMAFLSTGSVMRVTAKRGGTFAAVSNALGTEADALYSVVVGPTLFMKLTMTAADTWSTEVSPDGLSWTDLGSGTFPRTISPTHYGLGVSRWGGGAEPSIASFEYVRVYNLA